MTERSQRITGLSPQKRDLLLKLSRHKQRPQRGSSFSPIVPVPREGDLPLSFAQQRLWFLDQLEPGSPSYNIPTVMRLTGPLSVAALRRSINGIVRRHEALRTNFATVAGRPVQIIAPALNVPLPVIDLRQLAKPEREAQVRRWAKEKARQPFDLARDPLLRTALLRLDESEHALLLTMHHIVSDVWSIGVFIRELAAFYQASLSGETVALAELPVQYVDFAAWQRRELQGEALEGQLSYWKKQLNGRLPALELPADRPRPAVQTFRGARSPFALPKTLTAALKRLSQQEGVTLFMTLLAAFQTLLHRYTGQEDIILGSPIANRNRPEIEGLMGFFVNTLVLRTDLSGDPTFRELLDRVREVTLGAYEHQDLPFERLVDELQPERDLSRNPLFQVMFALQNAPMPPLALQHLTLDLLPVDTGIARFDLSLFAWETEQGLRGALEYNTDLFDASTMTRLVSHFQTLLESVVTAGGAGQRLADVPLLTGAEQQRLVVEWNATATRYPQDRCLHELFEAQVERTPDAVAVVFQNQHLTYRELNRRSNQLAHYLGELGLRPEALVGICVERSPEMVIGALGVLKAGGAYLPLDPLYPQERLAFMLEDTRAPVVLTQSWLLDQLPQHKARVVRLDTDWETVARFPPLTPSRVATAGNLAYTIYTSGSTGKPKGVQILHRAVVNFVDTMRHRPGLTGRDVLLSVTTFSFDIAVLELFLPLTAGARVVLVSREVAADGAQLTKALAAFRATVMQATPATWRLLLDAGWQDREGLRVLCGGEALPLGLAGQLSESAAEVWNLYGPTETTVWSSIWQVEPGGSAVPIGRPIGNTQTYLLDQRLRPVPVGVPGELYIGGDGLARGYLKRPGLTATKFVPNPFPSVEEGDQGTQGGARLYRTGDLVRYLPHGDIEFLGRLDHQVKVRGFRIELGEIETTLEQHPGVRQGVVLARDEGGATSPDTRLVAYLVPDPATPPTVSGLRHFLRARLPDYMIPSAYVVLDALPLTANDKVDRRALPPPDDAHIEREQVFVAPSSPYEETLAQVWQEILQLERVGVHDNFFNLGGHSLLATQVVSRVRDAFQVEIPLRALFEAPTIAGLATVIAHQTSEQIEEQDLDEILATLEGLSDQEAEAILRDLFRDEPAATLASQDTRQRGTR